MDQIALLQTLLLGDPLRRHALQTVASLRLPDCWIGAGFVRDAVWDYRHGFENRPPNGDVDVVWFAPQEPREEIDRRIEHELHSRLPGLDWSVRNQARMHLRNGDTAYQSVADAMRHWPETATAVAARTGPTGWVEINAPLGVDDLFAMRLRPTQSFAISKRSIFEGRISSKRWLERYPQLTLE